MACRGCGGGGASTLRQPPASDPQGLHDRPRLCAWLRSPAPACVCVHACVCMRMCACVRVWEAGAPSGVRPSQLLSGRASPAAASANAATRAASASGLSVSGQPSGPGGVRAGGGGGAVGVGGGQGLGGPWAVKARSCPDRNCRSSLSCGACCGSPGNARREHLWAVVAGRAARPRGGQARAGPARELRRLQPALPCRACQGACARGDAAAGASAVVLNGQTVTAGLIRLRSCPAGPGGRAGSKTRLKDPQKTHTAVSSLTGEPAAAALAGPPDAPGGAHDCR